MKALDLKNKKFNSLTAIRKTTKNKDRSYKWLFKCDCGIKRCGLSEPNFWGGYENR